MAVNYAHIKYTRNVKDMSPRLILDSKKMLYDKVHVMSQSDNETTFAIGELAREFDITPRSIRFYEEQGLLSPTRTGQNRVYLNKDRARLKLILRGKRLGFSLAEVKTLFDMYDSNPNSAVQLEAMLEMSEQKRAVLNQQLEDIQMLMTELDDVETRCREELAELKRGKIA